MPDDTLHTIHEEAEAFLERGDVASARRLYVRITESAPNDAEAWLMLGLIDSERGEDDAALSALHRATALDPELADAHFNLAGLLAKKNALAAATESCRKAVELDPAYEEAWLLLGVLYGRLGDLKRAADCSRRALAINPASVEAAANLGMALVGDGRYQEAAQVYSQAVQRHPADSALRAALGEVLLALGNHAEAQRSLLRARELNPADQRALEALARLHLERGRPDKAAPACQELLAQAPEHVAALAMSGTANQMMGNLREAVEYLGRAVALAPDDAENNYKLACACQALGDPDRALTHFTRTLELDPGSAAAIGGLVRVHEQKGDAEAVRHLLPALLDAAGRSPLVLPTLAAVASKYDVEDVSLAKLTRALEGTGLPDALRARLHWAAGTLLDRRGEYDSAFAHHRASKQLSGIRYDAGAHSAFVDRLIATFSAGFLAAAPRPTRAEETPVFIVGMPRSGTSLVEQILASHAQVYGAGERDTVSRIAESLPRRLGSRSRFPECCRELTPTALDSAGAVYLDALAPMAGAAVRVTDKMPHNFLHLGLIQLLFPGARVIHVRRDPLDTCLSCYFQEFSAAHAYSRSLDDLAAHYRDYRRLMRHWAQVLHLPLLELRYETLVEEPERTMRTLTEFCNLPWDPACARFHTSDRIVSTLSSAQVREPLNRKSIGRWKHYERHLRPLIAALDID
jgi:tetratricopeptide (TPR) repeat protein